MTINSLIKKLLKYYGGCVIKAYEGESSGIAIYENDEQIGFIEL